MHAILATYQSVFSIQNANVKHAILQRYVLLTKVNTHLIIFVDAQHSLSMNQVVP